MAPKRHIPNSPSPSPSKKKTKGGVKMDKIVTPPDVKNFFFDFKAAIEKHGVSPPGGDKDNPDGWSLARGFATSLAEKDIPVLSSADVESVGILKRFYSFEGRALVDRRRLAPDVVKSILAAALRHEVEILFV